ncbi:zinc finger protein 891-like [Trichogramma pretiosum]|uniref:zinc finger protein 891-like n=1 Tax=Trichogramma pretiosum TaxID=7493 RepID=UPI000C71B2C4|nr:zinc finger protein 891-like [Trichogramma pretiosum]
MESSDLFNSAVRVKEEPIDVSLMSNDRETIDEKPDLQNFQLLPHLRENSAHTFEKCELDDDVKIIVECKDVKPSVNWSVVEKIKDDSQIHLQNIKNSRENTNENLIKIETVSEVKQEIFDDDTERMNLNLDCELGQQNNARRIAKKLNNGHRFKKHMSTMNIGARYVCDSCGKSFSRKISLKIHIDAIHNGIKHPCDTCGEHFSNESNLNSHKHSLRYHIKTVHNGVKQL